LTFGTLAKRTTDTHWQQPALRSGGTLGARGWGVLGCRPDMALGWARGCYNISIIINYEHINIKYYIYI